MTTDAEIIEATRQAIIARGFNPATAQPLAEIALAICAPAIRAQAMVWSDGPPPHPWREEWFIAETTYGDRVVLRALPEEYAYDFTTADETYIKADKIKRWMQFPDSEYRTPVEAARAQAMEEAAKVADAFADKWATNARNARADSHSEAVCESAADAGRELASAIRALAPPAVAEKGESNG